jgi:hypothetical protein
MESQMRAGFRTRSFAVLVAVAIGASLLAAVPAGAVSDWIVSPSANPAFPQDAPDPHVVRFGSTYYAYTTGTTWGNRIGILKSAQPRSGWQVVGSALPTRALWQVNDTQNAPGVFRWAGRYVMYYNAQRIGGRRCLSVATSNSPEGPFTDNTTGPLHCQQDDSGAIDASPFVDSDGKAYLYWKNNDGFPPFSSAVSSVWVAPLSADGLALAGLPQRVMDKDDVHPPGNTVDNPQMVRVGGRYFLFFTGGDYLKASYAVGYAVCATRAGPCHRPYPAPILSSYGQVAGPGGGSVFRDAAGRWFIAYHAYAASTCGDTCSPPRRFFVAPMRQPFTWTPWERLDGNVVGGPAAASQKVNRLDVLARSTDGKVWRKRWNGGGWTAWGPLGGTPAGDPAAVSRSENTLDVFVRGTDNRIWRKVLNGSTWSPWVALPGTVAGDPAVASWGAKRLDLFVRGTDDQLRHKSWNGSGWSAWESLGGGFEGDPAAVSWGPNRIDVFVRGTGDQLRHRWWNGSSWSAWENLGGVLSGDPAASSWGWGRTDVFARGTDDRLYQRTEQNGGWSGWTASGSGILAGDPAAVSWAPGRIDAFARAGNGRLLHKYWF